MRAWLARQHVSRSNSSQLDVIILKATLFASSRKSLVHAVVVVSALAAPVICFAQSNAPVTRAEVRAQLVQLEKAGYDPSRNDPEYPADIQAAEARVAAEDAAATANAGTHSYGPETGGTSQSGAPVVAPGANSIGSGR
jgi:Domain of unknown function (DUF4148)